ncbi:MAG: hypothetical protein HYW70_00285 [Candidatus Nealsonbacteria bacterium]|nr:hypothetical protein [Candidatus Nealsonbacteria bacterium]
MSLPEPEREPRFQKEFAKIYGVGEDTLTNYKKKRGFWDEIQEQWKEWGKDRTSNVMMKFYESIIRKGSTGDFKLWFEYFLDWAERQELTRKGGRPIPILGGKTKKRNSIP